MWHSKVIPVCDNVKLSKTRRWSEKLNYNAIQGMFSLPLIHLAKLVSVLQMALIGITWTLICAITNKTGEMQLSDFLSKPKWCCCQNEYFKGINFILFCFMYCQENCNYSNFKEEMNCKPGSKFSHCETTFCFKFFSCSLELPPHFVHRYLKWNTCIISSNSNKWKCILRTEQRNRGDVVWSQQIQVAPIAQSQSIAQSQHWHRRHNLRYIINVKSVITV